MSANLVFIPFPIASHLATAVQAAKLLTDRDERLSITVIVMEPPMDTKTTSHIENTKNSRINFVELPFDESNSLEAMKSRGAFLFWVIDSRKGAVRDTVARIMDGSKSTRIAGLVVDMFCTAMIDVAKELGVPSYVYFTCSAMNLRLMLHLQTLKDDLNHGLAEYEDSDFETTVPGYINPVPARVWPRPVFEKDIDFLGRMRKFRETNGIMVNTFLEFEHEVIKSICDGEKIPPVYPIGPILQDGQQLSDQNEKRNQDIVEWLNDQPDSSVVFLCFGTRGYFSENQVKEIAVGLERSGKRFLWSLRKPPPNEKLEYAGEYENPGEVLPEGFLERTVGFGKVIGWAPQMVVLAHRAVGGFVSHCGWNSILESIWYGVPIATWPLVAEQQTNAFELVKEFGVAIEIKMDYKRDSNVIVSAEMIGNAIEQLMDPENGIRGKVSALKEDSRRAVMERGSSYHFVKCFIDDVMNNIC
ncbi:UDP-glucuronosyl and UDP-glucosyl transferase [Handroanthus impetiginosus]|uniref:Glycosyltransferase n=1 Tax=Handroanthus impetiginosus TaxID=429701 RepID=A0A2G9HXD2_9LAMI|nr:UDP-glucuronosyl and UDP-glucosyl transferase [Handroanthus impetiginosus]